MVAIYFHYVCLGRHWVRRIHYVETSVFLFCFVVNETRPVWCRSVNVATSAGHKFLCCTKKAARKSSDAQIEEYQFFYWCMYALKITDKVKNMGWFFKSWFWWGEEFIIFESPIKIYKSLKIGRWDSSSILGQSNWFSIILD